MKEKIKELLAKTQAFGPGGETMDRYNCSLYDLEKFAKLIIQECAKVAVATPCPITDEVSKQSQGHTWDMATIEAARAIKQYFNVNNE
jgi:hypothetical protein